MKALPVDTLKYVKILTNAKVPREQAEAHVEALTMALTDSVATKEDVNQVRNDLTQEINQVRNDLTQEINQVRNDLTQEINQVRNDLTQEINQVRNDLTYKIDMVEKSLTIKMGKLAAWQIGTMIGLLSIFTTIILAVLHH